MPHARLLLFICLLALGAGGCASLPLIAALDVMNVAETGKTGYDMATGLSSRRSLDQEVSPDAQAEARLRAVMDGQGGLLKYASVQVVQGRGYVVGVYSTPKELERVRKAVQGVKGVSETTLCLFPAGSNQLRGVTDGEMRDNILRLSGVRTSDEQQHLLESARYAGAASVQNHVRLFAAK